MCRKLLDPPPDPTLEQLHWAHDHGFPGWPSIKLGTAAYRQVRRLYCIVPDPPSIDALSMRVGIPIAVDPHVHPWHCETVEDAWAAEQIRLAFKQAMDPVRS